MKTRSERKVAARVAEARFIRAQNNAMRDRILAREMDTWPELRNCISPTIRELLAEIGGAYILDTVTRANGAYLNTPMHLLTQSVVVAAARARMRAWNCQRKALERVLTTRALIYWPAVCAYSTRAGRKVSLLLYGAIRITENWRAREEMGNAIIVKVDRAQLPVNVCRWIDRQTSRHERLHIDYITPSRIVDFVRGLRAHMRSCGRECKLDLSSFAMEG